MGMGLSKWSVQRQGQETSNSRGGSGCANKLLLRAEDSETCATDFREAVKGCIHQGLITQQSSQLGPLAPLMPRGALLGDDARLVLASAQSQSDRA